MKLEELFAKFQCNDNTLVLTDPWVGFFQYLAGRTTRVDLMPGFKNPQSYAQGMGFGGQVFEGIKALPDLWVDNDGIFYINFPGYGEPHSSESLVNDFRLLVLAKWAILANGFTLESELTVIFEMYYPGHTVKGSVPYSTWNIVGKMIDGLMNTPRPRTPGNHCLNCSQRDTCKPFQDYANRPGMEVEETGDPADMGQKLYLALIAAQTQEDVYREKRKTLLKRFMLLADEGKVQIGELFKMRVRANDSDRFPYTQTVNILSSFGLWGDKYGRIDVKALKKDIPSFPPEARERLARIKFTETRDYDLREIMEENANGIQAAIFSGVSART